MVLLFLISQVFQKHTNLVLDIVVHKHPQVSSDVLESILELWVADFSLPVWKVDPGFSPALCRAALCEV